MSARRAPSNGLLLLLTVTVIGTAHAQTVTLYAFRASDCRVLPPATMGVSLGTPSPSSVVLGHLPPAGAVGEMAVSQQIIASGDEVPLPMFADGSSAQESEVFWTAQLWLVNFPGACGVVRYRGDRVTATFSGRRLVSTFAQIDNGGPVPPATDAQVLVTAVAFRLHDRRKLKD